MSVEIEIAQAKRTCHMCERKIEKHKSCLTLRKGLGMYAVIFNLCPICLKDSLKTINKANSYVAISKKEDYLHMTLANKIEYSPLGESKYTK